MNYALLEAQLNNINAQTSIANLDTFQLNYISPVQRQIKELELQIAAIEKGKFERRLEFLKRINESELKKIQLQIKREENQADRIKELLDAMVLLAPLDGMALRATSRINRDNKIQVGDQVWDNVPLLSIPDMSLMKVVIQAPETDYRRISLNDSVIFTFDAMPGNKAWGKILKIAPMGRSLSRNASIKVFDVTASVDSFLSIPEPGLSAQCNIVMKQLADTIVVPQLAIFDEDSIRVVYVVEGNNYLRHEVVTGIASPREAVIAAGLKGNELLSFVKPPSHKVLNFTPVADSVKQWINSLNVDTLGLPMNGMMSNEVDEPFYEIIILN
jgi:HlyD family secretion protein